MNKLLILVFILVLISCKSKVENIQLEDELSLRSDSAMNVINGQYQAQMDSFVRYLGILPSGSISENPQDTMITFIYNYSFAGAYAGKYSQILKTDSGAYFTQVFYRDGKKKKEEGFRFVNFFTKDTSRKRIYAEQYKKCLLSENEWNSLISEFEKRKFFEMNPNEEDTEVFDATYSDLIFQSASREYQVSRINKGDADFYYLCKKVDGLSKDTLEEF